GTEAPHSLSKDPTDRCHGNTASAEARSYYGFLVCNATTLFCALTPAILMTTFFGAAGVGVSKVTWKEPPPSGVSSLATRVRRPCGFFPDAVFGPRTSTQTDIWTTEAWNLARTVVFGIAWNLCGEGTHAVVTVMFATAFNCTSRSSTSSESRIVESVNKSAWNLWLV